MHQHEDIRPTTEDIAGTDTPRDDIDRDGIGRDDVDRTELGRAEMDRAKADRDNLDQDDFGQDNLHRDNLDRDDFGRNDADRNGIGGTETSRTDADGADTDRTDTDRTDAYRDEADRDRLGTTDEDSVVEVDETARPTDTTLANSNLADSNLADSNLAGSNAAGSNLDSSGLTGAQGSAGANESHPHDAAARENVTDVLFDEGEATRLRERWREVQAEFVDDPKQAVQDADVLVAELMQTLAAAFSERKRLLEQQWREGSETETEDLRLTLRGYRSFLDQLLTH